MESLRGGPRTLTPLPVEPDDADGVAPTAALLLDPEKTLEWTELVRQFVSP